MECNVISTGSAGNAVLLDGTILIDCGVPMKRLEQYYKEIKLVLLTHCHGDHFNPITIRELHRRRPSMRFACGPWLYQYLTSIGISNSVIDYVDGIWMSYGAVKVKNDRIPHDVPNCAWHIRIGDELAIYATDTSTLSSVEAPCYDLYMIEANHTEEELHDRWRRKIESGEFAYEYRVASTHLSREKAIEWLSDNATLGSKVQFLHQHKEKNEEEENA